MTTKSSARITITYPHKFNKTKDAQTRKARAEMDEYISWINELAQDNPQKAWEMLYHAASIMLTVSRFVKAEYDL